MLLEAGSNAFGCGERFCWRIRTMLKGRWVGGMLYVATMGVWPLQSLHFECCPDEGAYTLSIVVADGF